MRLSAAFAARGKRLKGKAKQFRFALARLISLIALGAVLSGFFYAIFLNSLDSFSIAKESSHPLLSTFGNMVASVRAEGKPSENTIRHAACDEPLPMASIAAPTLTVFMLEQMCEPVPADQPAQKIELTPQALEEMELEKQRNQLAQELKPILQGTPMEQMIEPISAQPRIVAAFLVGIAKKESQLGKYAPSKNGVDCHNYWGFKGQENPVSGGYSCFSSPEEAVRKVGARLEKFAIEQKRDAPAKMLVWKCGSSCETHSPDSVAKWVSDVSIHFHQINNPKQPSGQH